MECTEVRCRFIGGRSREEELFWCLLEVRGRSYICKPPISLPPYTPSHGSKQICKPPCLPVEYNVIGHFVQVNYVRPEDGRSV